MTFNIKEHDKSANMLNVVMLSVIMLNVEAPY
jgi:hypothetical protein